MSRPQGSASRLWFGLESTPGTLSAFSATRGLKPYFRSFMPDLELNESDYEECTGSAAGADKADLVLDPLTPTFPLSFALRYSGVHAVLLGAAIGSVDTSGAGPQYKHDANGSAGTRLNPYSFLGHTALDNGLGSTGWSEIQAKGCKCSRMRLSQSAESSLIMVEQEWLYMGHAWLQTPTSTSLLPPDTAGSGYSPHEQLIRASHITSGSAISITGRGRSAVTLRVRSWEIVVDNKLTRDSIIQYGGSSLAGVEPSRSDTREITATFTVEAEGAVLDELNTLAMLTPNATSTDCVINWTYELPSATSSYDAAVVLSNCYILKLERGTDGPGLQSRTFTVRASKTPTGLGANTLGWPLSFSISNLLLEPSGSTMGTEYADYCPAA